jgi:hypothetical protein
MKPKSWHAASPARESWSRICGPAVMGDAVSSGSDAASSGSRGAVSSSDNDVGQQQ